MNKNKLNGSVDALAGALRDVLTESIELAIEPVRTDIKGVGQKVEKTDTTVNTLVDLVHGLEKQGRENTDVLLNEMSRLEKDVNERKSP